jgi:hypothetical protein
MAWRLVEFGFGVFIILQSSGLNPNALHTFCITSGPGPFFGLRDDDTDRCRKSPFGCSSNETAAR